MIEMSIHRVALSALFLSLATGAFAQEGTPQQRAACTPDVRRLCYQLGKDADSQAYLHCLQQNHDKLSEACRVVIDGK
jgi:hypothetical protein